jgi:ABC-type antimicrobial peptide transport system permease subunit
MLGPYQNPNIDETGFYLPFYSYPVGPVPPDPLASQFATLVVRPHPGTSAESLTNTLRRQVGKVDANLPLYFVGTPRSHIDASLAASRILATMFTLFGGIAMLLAAVGIYGVVAFAVSQQRQEYGVRMALGADRLRILRHVFVQNGRPLLAGLLVGLALSFTLASLAGDAIANMLFGVSPTDPLAYGSVISLVIVVSAVAMLVPARRATQVDPVVALRAE